MDSNLLKRSFQHCHLSLSISFGRFQPPYVYCIESEKVLSYEKAQLRIITVMSIYKKLFYICVGFFSPVLLFILWILYPVFFNEYTLEGPTSPTGLKVKVYVSDAGWGWGADFNADIKFINNNNKSVFHWEDRHGRGYKDNLLKFVKEMKWVNDKTFVFYDGDYKTVVIQYPDNGYWTITKDSKYY